MNLQTLLFIFALLAQIIIIVISVPHVYWVFRHFSFFTGWHKNLQAALAAFVFSIAILYLILLNSFWFAVAAAFALFLFQIYYYNQDIVEISDSPAPKQPGRPSNRELEIKRQKNYEKWYKYGWKIRYRWFIALVIPLTELLFSEKMSEVLKLILK